jgi:hypothetical protein
MQRIGIRLQIHSTLSSWSSRDELLYIDMLETEFETFSKQIGKEWHVELKNETYIGFQKELKIIELEDTQYYKTLSGNATTQQMEEKVEYYTSKYPFKKEMTQFLKLKFKDDQKRRKKEWEEEAKRIGRVFDNYDYIETKHRKLVDFKGGFSTKFFNKMLEDKDFNDYLVSAIELNSGVFGYIGASERIKGVDKQIEDKLIEKNGFDKAGEIFAIFATTGSGRHFADNIDEDTIITEDDTQYMLETYNGYTKEALN